MSRTKTTVEEVLARPAKPRLKAASAIIGGKGGFHYEKRWDDPLDYPRLHPRDRRVGALALAAY